MSNWEEGFQPSRLLHSGQCLGKNKNAGAARGLVTAAVKSRRDKVCKKERSVNRG